MALQNNDLQKELDEFVMTDEIIRNGLDRKGRVQQMKDVNCYNERQSLAYVDKSRSPRRAGSRSPMRVSNTQQQTKVGSLTQTYLNYNRGECE